MLFHVSTPFSFHVPQENLAYRLHKWLELVFWEILEKGFFMPRRGLQGEMAFEFPVHMSTREAGTDALRLPA